MIDSPEDAEWPCLRCVWDGRIMVPKWGWEGDYRQVQ
jgi:hypothetical protein